MEPDLFAQLRDQNIEIILKAIKRVKADSAAATCRQEADFPSPGLRETSFVFAVRLVLADGHFGQSEEALIALLVQR